MLFSVICPSVLESEIVADLGLEKLPKGRTPEDRVKDVASKMLRAHASIKPVMPRTLILNEVYGQQIPMDGVPPVQEHAKASSDGKYVIHDSTPMEAMWARLTRGEFDEQDRETAARWREGIDDVDLERLRRDWGPFSRDVLGSPNTIDAVIAAVDAELAKSDSDVKRGLLKPMLDAFDIEEPDRMIAFTRLDADPTAALKDILPYCASVVRLLLAYICALARGIIGPRVTDRIDLQYLFYAPYCAGFVSSDQLHEKLWPATTTDGMFVRGEDMKRDLQQRAAKRKAMTAEDWKQHHRKYGHHPEPLDDSSVNQIWEVMGPPRPFEPDDQPRSLADFDPATRERLEKALGEFKKMLDS